MKTDRLRNAEIKSESKGKTISDLADEDLQGVVGAEETCTCPYKYPSTGIEVSA